MVKRPEWVHCIRQDALSNQEKRPISWCGREIGAEWHFTGVDHAALNGLNGGRLQACNACAYAAHGALTKGTHGHD